MRNSWLLLLVMAMSLAGFAQGPGGAGGRRGGMGGGVPSIGHFYGKVVDAKTNKGIDGVSIQLIQSKFDTATKARKDTVISGMITRRSGEFSLENLPILGNFRLVITAIGYGTYDQKVAFDLKGLRGAAGAVNGGAAGSEGSPNMSSAINAVDKDLGNIKMAEDAQSLAQVTVTATKPLIQMGVDRKIYNVEKDISAQGGTGVDVMKNVPSLQVDIDGNVTLRNSSPTIFVDGRPSTLTLDQIPADAIQSVEIITNPGAKYDASGGTAGILNIVLKKNRKAGYNGNVRAGIDQRGKFNLGSDINVKQGKINFFVNGNYNQRKSISNGNTDRYTFFSTKPDSLHQHDHNVNDGYFAFGRAGIDYLINNRNTISLSGNIVHGNFNPTTTSDLNVDTLFPSGTKYSQTLRNSESHSNFNNHGAMLSYKHTFPKAGEELTADVNYSQGANDNLSLVTSKIYPIKGDSGFSNYQQRQVGNGDNKYFTAQADYVLPLTEKSKFEAGGRVAIRNNTSLNNLDTLNSANQFVTNQLLSSHYHFTDKVFAGYASYGNAVNNFTYQLGLRMESSNYNGTQNFTAIDSSDPANPRKQVSSVGNFKNQFPLSFFPSVFLTQKFGGDQDLAFNYTRRIDRPNFFQLFPFTDYSDSLNLSRGNPNLKPQFTNSFELGYQKSYSGNTFLASVYYKYTTDLITRQSSLGVNPVNDSTVIINTYINAKSSFVGGLELISRTPITKWWDLTTSVNVFTSKINTIDTGKFAVPSQGQTWSWFGKINNSFKLTKALTLQVTGDYTSKTVLPPGGSASNGGGGGGGGRGGGGGFGGGGGGNSGNANGYSKPTGGVDASIRYEFLKNRVASVTLSVSDIFRTRVNDVYISSGSFIQEADRRRDPQFFRLQFNYRFGKFDMALFKRKNMKGERDSMEGLQGQGGGAQPSN